MASAVTSDAAQLKVRAYFAQRNPAGGAVSILCFTSPITIAVLPAATPGQQQLRQ